MRTTLLLAIGITAGAIIQAGVDGRKPKPLPMPVITEIRDSTPLPAAKTWNVSAYCPCVKCCGEYSKGVHYRQTANGHKIQPGDKLIAAPKSIPFGTWIDVPGYGRAQVKDRGGAIKEGCLDLYFDSHSDALQWGRKHISVKILTKS